MRIVEAWGTGIRRIIQAAELYGLHTPEIQVIKKTTKNNNMSTKTMAETIMVSSRTIEKNIKQLKNRGLLVRHGSSKSGYWETVK